VLLACTSGTFGGAALLLSLAFIFVTVAGLWLKIRRIKRGGH
jgi:hypothetical protein